MNLRSHSVMISTQALMLAAAVDNAEGVDVLLDAGASVELADALGRTALMFAAGRGAPCALIALLRAGASVRLLNVCHPFGIQTGTPPTIDDTIM